MRKPLPAVVCAAVLGCAAIAAAACSGTTNSTTNPVPSAVAVRGSDVSSGIGCGTGAQDVFRYAAVVHRKDAPDPALAGGVYDCFADAQFVFNTDAVVPFGTELQIDVLAWGKAAYDAARPAIDAAGTNEAALRAARPAWTQQCTVVYLPSVETFASCSAPAASGGGDAGAEAGADGGTAP